MIDHVWTVVCSRAVIDRESNNVSIQNVIEQITIQGEPLPDGWLGIEMTAISLWARSAPDTPARGKMRLSFVSPSGVELGSFEGKINLNEHPRSRNIFRFTKLPLKENGWHYFRVYLQINGEWQEIGKIPLEVSFLSEDETLTDSPGQ